MVFKMKMLEKFIVARRTADVRQKMNFARMILFARIHKHTPNAGWQSLAYYYYSDLSIERILVYVFGMHSVQSACPIVYYCFCMVGRIMPANHRRIQSATHTPDNRHAK